MDSTLTSRFNASETERQIEMERVIAQLARSDSAAEAITEAIMVREKEIASLTIAAGEAAGTIAAICAALDMPTEPAITLRQRLLDQLEGIGERLTGIESQQTEIIDRQQQELWQRRAELHAALRPRSRWIHLMRVAFPPKPGNLDHLLQKGL